MKLHFFTEKTAPYSFELFVNLFEDEEFKTMIKKETIEEILNSHDVRESFYDSDRDELKEAIASLYDIKTNGVFDWEEETDEYYSHFDRMINYLRCNAEYDSGKIIAEFDCKLSDMFDLDDQTLSITVPGFYTGNGEPIGSQLALDLVENFLKENQWHVGFFDSNGALVTDVASWAKNNKLDIQAITPVVWFGLINDIQKCWSITPKTSDSFIKEFWDDYFEGALEHICNASAGYSFYYSVFEYGLNHDDSLFKSIKSCCPIDLSLPDADRANALYNLIISVYNETLL